MQVVNAQVVDFVYAGRCKHRLLTPNAKFLLRHGLRDLPWEALNVVSEPNHSFGSYDWNGEQVSLN